MIFSFRRPQYFTSHTGFSWSPVTDSLIVTWAWAACGFGGFNMATASPSSSSSSSSFITTTVRDLGNLQQLSKKEKAFLTEGIKDKKLFPPLPTPDEDAWLSSHTETQQSHAAWSRKFQSVVTAASQNNKICLVPLGDEWTESEVDVDKSSNKESFLSLLQRFAAAFFTGELCWSDDRNWLARTLQFCSHFFQRKNASAVVFLNTNASLSRLCTDVPPPSGKMTSPLPIFSWGRGDVCTQARLELFNDCKSRTRPGLVLQVSRSQSCNQKRRAWGCSKDNFLILLMTLAVTDHPGRSTVGCWASRNGRTNKPIIRHRDRFMAFNDLVFTTL